MTSVEKVKECAETHRGRLARVTLDTFEGFRDSPWGIIVGFTSGEKPRVVIQIGDKHPEAREPWDVADFHDMTWAMRVGLRVLLAEPGMITVHDAQPRGYWDLIAPGAAGNQMRLKAFWGAALAKNEEAIVRIEATDGQVLTRGGWRMPVLDEVAPAATKEEWEGLRKADVKSKPKMTWGLVKSEMTKEPDEGYKWHVMEQPKSTELDHFRFMDLTLTCPKPGLASIVSVANLDPPNPIRGLPEPCARCYTESTDFEHTCGAK